MTVKPWSELLSPIESSGPSEAIVRRLGELIASGVLEAGVRLPNETELAEAFSVAPMTVRNALHVLREGGFVETRRGRYAGTFVRADIAHVVSRLHDETPEIEQFVDFTTWRVAISGEAVALAAQKATAAELDHLADLIDTADTRALRFEDYRFADARVHLYITELSGSARLVLAEQQIQAEMSRALTLQIWQPDLDRLPAQRHDQIMAALRAGDSDEARRSMSAHIRSTLDLVVGTGFATQSTSDHEAEDGGSALEA